MQNKKAQAIVMIAELFGTDLSESRLRAYLLGLEDITAEQLGIAFKLCAQSPTLKFLPTPGELRAMILPKLSPRQEAISSVDAIKRAITRWGWPQPEKAEADLGLDLWRVVVRLGGWKYLCESPDAYLDNPTIYAQTRDKVEAQVSAKRSGIDYDRPSLAGSNALRLEGMGDPKDFLTLLGKKEEE